MELKLFDFHLPKELIADRPLPKRDHSRMLVVLPEGKIEHKHFYNLPEYVNKGDLLILNNTRVIPARITGRKPTGGKLEILIVDKLGPGEYTILSRGGYTGRLYFEDSLQADIIQGKRAIFNKEDITDFLWKQGRMPLPPYIKRQPTAEDRLWYQTVYAEKEGSIAAPTAGLHFTKELLTALSKKGVRIAYITLHVGVGTFMPVKTEHVEQHRMAEEYFELKEELISLIHTTRENGNRVIAVGTTVTRTLEALFSGHYKKLSSVDGIIKGKTDLFIYPGYRFKAIDSLITNFHLPRSTPLILVSALVGRERLLKTYQEAIKMGYRFFSYGDGMLVL